MTSSVILSISEWKIVVVQITLLSHQGWMKEIVKHSQDLTTLFTNMISIFLSFDTIHSATAT